MTYSYNNKAKRWFDDATGRFAPENDVIDEMRNHQEATYTTLENMTRRLYAGDVSIEQWETAVATELKDAHLSQAMYGAGGKYNMTSENYGRVGRTLRTQYEYLDQFARDIRNGKVSESQAMNRIQMYGDATQQSYWKEFIQSSPTIYWNLGVAEHCPSCISLANRSPFTSGQLHQVPGDGKTDCRTNCKCTLSRMPVSQEDTTQ